MAGRAEDGVRTARVVDNLDPKSGGRVRVEFAARPRRPATTVWARLATLAAGDQRGTWFPPAVGDEVLVAFEGGDAAKPVVIGALWSTGAAPPETGPDRTERTTIRTRSGAVIRIEEQAAAGAPATITVDTGSGDAVELGPVGVTVTSSNQVEIRAAGRLVIRAAAVEINASTIDTSAAIARFGMVQCDTLTATNVIAASYSPGAGNVM